VHRLAPLASARTADCQSLVQVGAGSLFLDHAAYTIVSPDLQFVADQGDAFQGTFTSTPKLDLDYAMSDRDPLFPTQVWYSQIVSNSQAGGQKQVILGARQHPVYEDP